MVDKAWHHAQNTLKQPQGRVRITAPDALIPALLAPAITQLIRQFPLLNIELLGSDQQLSLSADNIDLAIRVGSSASSSAKQRRIGRFRDVLCAATDVATQGVDESTVYIANLWQGSNIEHRFTHNKTGECFSFSPRNLCKVSSFNAAVALISEGAGVGLVPEFLLHQLQPKICNVFAEYQLPANTVYALHPYQAQLPLNVLVCLQTIEGQLQKLM